MARANRQMLLVRRQLKASTVGAFLKLALPAGSEALSRLSPFVAAVCTLDLEKASAIGLSLKYRVVTLSLKSSVVLEFPRHRLEHGGHLISHRGHSRGGIFFLFSLIM